MKLNKKNAWVVFVCIVLVLGTGAAFAQRSSMKVAIEEGKKYAGKTIVFPTESGLFMQGPLALAPQWEKATGMKVEVVGMDYYALHDKQIAEHLAATGAYDIVQYSPLWVPDFVAAGLMEPLDRYVEKYMNKEDLEDIPPVVRKNLMMWGGTFYGLPIDLDILTLFYRKDLFEDSQNKAEFESQYGYELRCPQTWKEFQEIATFFTEKYAPDIYGAAIQRAMQTYTWFEAPFVAYGGRYFNPETMEPEINNAIGVRTLTEMVEQNKVMPPGIETWDFMDVLSAWLSGKVAMIITWPPIGRWSEGYGTYTKQLAWVPKTEVAGNVGYGPMPLGRSTHAGCFSLGVNSGSKNKEAAYLFAQWARSPGISLQTVMLPFALCDPWRISHFEAPLYRNAWGNAGEYLDTLRESAMHGVWELAIPAAFEYFRALEEAMTAAYGGKDVQAALDEAAGKWEKITNRLGRETQRKFYIEWLRSVGQSP